MTELEQIKIETEKSTLYFSSLDHRKVRNEYQELLGLGDDDY